MYRLTTLLECSHLISIPKMCIRQGDCPDLVQQLDLLLDLPECEASARFSCITTADR